MRKVKCEKCGRYSPMKDAVTVLGKVWCQSCFEADELKREGQLEGMVESLIDPTLCRNCGKDNGIVPYETLAGLPTCPECQRFFRSRPFPTWIKASFILLVVLVIFSLIWNMRFIRAYRYWHQSEGAIQSGDVVRTSNLLSAAVELVPECEEFHVLRDYYQGLIFLRQGFSEAALVKLRSCQGKLPSECGIDEMILRAEIDVSFESENYDGFLAAAKSLCEMYPEDAIMLAQVASAYACKYAVTGEAQYEKQSMDFLDRAREIGYSNPGFIFYEDRILYRLYNREIIDHEEFLIRFPNGWNLNRGE